MDDPPRDDAELLAIGRFARLCRLSIKQLRHYDELGLLVPAWVDTRSGYRYYRPEQARVALTIGLLRSLDVPLADISQLLDGAPAADVLGKVRDQLEAELARRQQSLVMLERLLADGVPRSEVSLVQVAPRRVALVRDVTSPSRIGPATSACVRRLLDAFVAAGQVPGQPIIGLFPLDVTDELTVAVTAGADAPVAGTTADLLPGGTFASATHLGPYGQIGLTAHALLAWCGERGHQPQGSLREVYVNDPNTTPPDQLVTHLMIRLEDPS
ncbi:MerR family transcriptional regulator [Actinopolymorpha alba]|uniref:MerR family transcriptional regulator n=1 Tax=Actinopolymorpha alba TaxID=533267 RepID=UPI00036C61E3|nr:MerR family transcriptional regulator [Actinopolymorpha alba]